MKVVVVYLGTLGSLPPLISLIRLLRDIGSTCEFVGVDSPSNRTVLAGLAVEHRLFACDLKRFSLRSCPFQWFKAIFSNRYRRHAFRKAISTTVLSMVGDSQDVIVWTVGAQVFELLHDFLLSLGRRHVNISYELIEHRTSGGLKLVHDDIYRAATLVQCEPNRAEIFAGIYGLNRVPFVIPNCPYPHPRKRFLKVSNPAVDSVVSGWKDKIVFLYQGAVACDRGGLVELLERLCDAFPEAIVALMPSYTDGKYGTLLSKPNFYLLPSLPAPHHLEVTSHATIGIATYCRGSTGGLYSPLNVVYCAPNKIYEYAGFGIPMLCNDLPGVRYVFEKFHTGVCYNDGDFDEAINIVRSVLADYKRYEKSAVDYFSRIDLKKIVSDIVDSARRVNG